jgi:hypothetical protein
MVLEVDRLAGQQSAVLPADGALPEPGLIAVLGHRRAIARAALGKQPRRGGLVGARLHEGVAHGVADERQVELRVTAAEMEIEGGGEFDQLDCIGHCEHGVPLSGQNARNARIWQISGHVGNIGKTKQANRPAFPDPFWY